MGTEPCKVLQMCLHRDFLSEELHTFRALQKTAAQGALALIAHKEDGAFRPPEVMLEVVADTARVAHTGSGDNDLRRGVLVQGLGFLAALGQAEIGEAEHFGALPDEPHGVMVHVPPEVAVKDRSSGLGKGGVDVNGEIGDRLHQMLFFDFADKVEQLLGASHGKGRNDDIAAPGHGFVNNSGKIFGISPAFGMIPVAIGGFHDDVIRSGNLDGVTDDGLIDIADISGEDDAFLDAVLGQIHGDKGGAQKVSRVHIFQIHALAEVDQFAVFAGIQEL